MVNTQDYESYIPVYDTVPETWDEARPFLVEQLKKIGNEDTTQQIGWYLRTETVTGKLLFATQNMIDRGGESDQYRTIFRKVFDFQNPGAGVNTQAHGLSIDANFTLIHMYGAVSNANTRSGRPIPSGQNTGDWVAYTSANVQLNLQAPSWTRGIVVMEYTYEL